MDRKNPQKTYKTACTNDSPCSLPKNPRRSTRLSTSFSTHGHSSRDNGLGIHSHCRTPDYLKKAELKKHTKGMEYLYEIDDGLSDTEVNFKHVCKKDTKSKSVKSTTSLQVTTKKYSSGLPSLATKTSLSTCASRNKKCGHKSISSHNIPSVRTPKMNISYNLSDISDDENTSKLSDFNLMNVKLDPRDHVSTLSSLSMPGPSGIYGTKSKATSLNSLLSSNEISTTTSEDLQPFIDGILSNTKYERQYKGTEDFVNETQKLLAMTNDLIELHDSEIPDQSVVFVGEIPASKPEKRRFNSLMSIMEKQNDIIDLSSPISKPYTVETKPIEKKTTANRNIGECPICFESLDKLEVAATTCGHVFCNPCIRNAILTSKKCPNCRKHLTLKQIHPLFI